MKQVNFNGVVILLESEGQCFDLLDELRNKTVIVHLKNGKKTMGYVNYVGHNGIRISGAIVGFADIVCMVA